MQWSDISFRPPSRTLRQFAGLWIVFFGALACWHGILRDHTTVALVLAGLALTVGPLGLVSPPSIRLIFVGAMVITFPIGLVVSRLLLAFVYYGLFTPTGLIFKLIGRDALALRHRPDVETYWALKPGTGNIRNYFRQS